jgi:Cu/Ag efflux protein CusF
MIKSLRTMTLASLLAAVILAVPIHVSAQSTNKPAATAPDAKARSIPFHGKLAAVDKTAKTITLDEKTKREFQVTSETRIMKDDKPATLDDATVGDAVRGSYRKGDDGKLTLRSLTIGAKGEPAPKKSEKKEPAAK